MCCVYVCVLGGGGLQQSVYKITQVRETSYNVILVERTVRTKHACLSPVIGDM